jgi:hypothetical protein
MLSLIALVTRKGEQTEGSYIRYDVTTYRVPAGRFITSRDCSPSKALARPKSEILGVMCASSNTLLGFKSLDDLETGLLVEITKASCDPADDHESFAPVQQLSFHWNYYRND